LCDGKTFLPPVLLIILNLYRSKNHIWQKLKIAFFDIQIPERAAGVNPAGILGFPDQEY
jgi:hypothetical protein